MSVFPAEAGNSKRLEQNHFFSLKCSPTKIISKAIKDIIALLPSVKSIQKVKTISKIAIEKQSKEMVCGFIIQNKDSHFE